jgi:hypothetical protein
MINQFVEKANSNILVFFIKGILSMYRSLSPNYKNGYPLYPLL